MPLTSFDVAAPYIALLEGTDVTIAMIPFTKSNTVTLQVAIYYFNHHAVIICIHEFKYLSISQPILLAV